jgi:predicted RNase H-like nuclease
VHEAVVECHPELVFAMLAAGRLAVPPKTSAAGALTRLALLEEALDQDLPVDVPAGASLDDALDAAACAITAVRWARGEAEVLGEQTDSSGIPMRIVV